MLTTTRSRVFAALLLGIGVATAFMVVRAAAVDPRMVACGANDPANKVLATFDLPRARDFWVRFPSAGLAPELEVDDPAFVVVFDGPASHPVIGPGPDPESADGLAVTPQLTRDHVVCVVVKGAISIYSDVSFVGFQP